MTGPPAVVYEGGPVRAPSGTPGPSDSPGLRAYNSIGAHCDHGDRCRCAGPAYVVAPRRYSSSLVRRSPMTHRRRDRRERCSGIGGHPGRPVSKRRPAIGSGPTRGRRPGTRGERSVAVERGPRRGDVLADAEPGTSATSLIWSQSDSVPSRQAVGHRGSRNGLAPSVLMRAGTPRPVRCR
jgi:hypothetical protein